MLKFERLQMDGKHVGLGFKFHVDKLTLSKYIDLGLQMVPYVCFLRGMNNLWG